MGNVPFRQVIDYASNAPINEKIECVLFCEMMTFDDYVILTEEKTNRLFTLITNPKYNDHVKESLQNVSEFVARRMSCCVGNVFGASGSSIITKVEPYDDRPTFVTTLNCLNSAKNVKYVNTKHLRQILRDCHLH